MIRTEHEYRKALEDLRRDEEVLTQQRNQLADLGLSGDEVQKGMLPMQSFHAQLREEVEAYERMRRGHLDILHHLTSIGRWLIGIRIARGMSQRELADILDVSETQVSRDENNEYHGITVERAQRILEALGVRFRMEVEEPVLTADEELAPA